MKRYSALQYAIKKCIKTPMKYDFHFTDGGKKPNIDNIK